MQRDAAWSPFHWFIFCTGNYTMILFWKQVVCRPSSAVSRDGLGESCTCRCRRRHYRRERTPPPPVLAGAGDPQQQIVGGCQNLRLAGHPHFGVDSSSSVVHVKDSEQCSCNTMNVSPILEQPNVKHFSPFSCASGSSRGTCVLLEVGVGVMMSGAQQMPV